MKKQELQRLAKMENRIMDIADEEGLCVQETIFEVVPARRMIEAMAYMFPVNFSHWSFGRDFDQHRTIYEHTGAGIPYEQVWNFDPPKALLVETNPFALNVLTMAHVVGHVDFFSRNCYTRHGRSFADIAEEARVAAARFRRYETRYTRERVEAIIDVGMSLRWQQPRDPLLEEPSEEEARDYLQELYREKIRAVQRKAAELGKEKANEEIRGLEKALRRARSTTPPEPVYDILQYIIARAPQLREWERDVLSVIWNQARALAPNRRTKGLNEGWAVYWHTRIMRRLFQEKLLSAEEHGAYLNYHTAVTQKNPVNLNVYHVYPALYEYICELWDKGRFGKAFEDCPDPQTKAEWDTKAGKGREKIFQVAASYTDHMAIAEFFTPEFIHALELYLYEQRVNESTGEIEYVIVENNPEIIRLILAYQHALYGMPSIAVVNGNYGGRGELYLRHDFEHQELDERYAHGTLRNTYYAWRKAVHLETIQDRKQVLMTFDGKKISISGHNSGSEEKEDDDGFIEL